jgi:hypothetical protein
MLKLCLLSAALTSSRCLSSKVPLKSDVELLQNHPLVKGGTVIAVWRYEAETGQVSISETFNW